MSVEGERRRAFGPASWLLAIKGQVLSWGGRLRDLSPETLRPAEGPTATERQREDGDFGLHP